MLADERSTRFLNDFSGQWLEVRNISTSAARAAVPVRPDAAGRDGARDRALLPEPGARGSADPGSAAGQLHLPERAAGAALRRSPGSSAVISAASTLTNEDRFGLLGQASVLTVTSYNDRTSVVRRGYWILDVLLGAPPPAAAARTCRRSRRTTRASKPAALRERMEQHRNNAVCASCHAQMDPLGFALEHYDAVGQFRRDRRRRAHRFGDQSSAARRSTVPRHSARRCSARATRSCGRSSEKLLIYALGRGLTYHDAPVVRQLVRDAARERLPVVDLDPGHRPERPVPDAEQLDSADARARSTVDIERIAAMTDDTQESRHVIITKMHLSRRTVLARLRRGARAARARQHGAGADRAQSRRRRRRSGASASSTCPTACRCRTGSRRRKGRSRRLPPTLRSLAAFKDRVLLCGGLADEPANRVRGGGDHARSAGTFLTGVPFKITSGADVYGSVSMDQIAAKELAKETQLASLELGIESNAMLGSCDGGASCAYTNTVAWSERRRRRCRSRTTRARCSNGCSARAEAPIAAPASRASSRIAAFSIS